VYPVLLTKALTMFIDNDLMFKNILRNIYFQYNSLKFVLGKGEIMDLPFLWEENNMCGVGFIF